MSQVWRAGLALLVFTVLVMAVLAVRGERSSGLDNINSVPLEQLEADTAAQLLGAFQSLGYTWPLGRGKPVPPIGVRRLPADLDALPVDEKKALFFRTMLPLALAENRRVLDQRARLMALLVGGINETEKAEVAAIAQEYRVSGDPTDPAVQKVLLRRIDAVPVALILAQAANESGWGTSRFAREGNSLFGEWTYDRDGGLAPNQADEGALHSVRAFDDLRASVRSYIYNLNVGHAYLDLRKARARLRAEGRPLDSLVLVQGLHLYSARGEDYVAEISQIIRNNGLTAVRNARLADALPLNP